MPKGRILFEDLFRKFAPEVVRLREEGFSDEEIRGAIGRRIKTLQSLNLSREEIDRFINPPEPRPTLGRRAGQSALSALTLGFVGGDVPPPVGLREAITDLLGGLGGSLPLIAGAQLAAAPAAGAVVAGQRVSPVVRSAIQGLIAGGVVSGAETGAEFARTGEVEESLEAAPTNLALFLLANLLPGIRQARRLRGIEAAGAPTEQRVLPTRIRGALTEGERPPREPIVTPPPAPRRALPPARGLPTNIFATTPEGITIPPGARRPLDITPIPARPEPRARITLGNPSPSEIFAEKGDVLRFPVLRNNVEVGSIELARRGKFLVVEDLEASPLSSRQGFAGGVGDVRTILRDAVNQPEFRGAERLIGVRISGLGGVRKIGDRFKLGKDIDIPISRIAPEKVTSAEAAAAGTNIPIRPRGIVYALVNKKTGKVIREFDNFNAVVNAQLIKGTARVNPKLEIRPRLVTSRPEVFKAETRALDNITKEATGTVSEKIIAAKETVESFEIAEPRLTINKRPVSLELTPISEAPAVAKRVIVKPRTARLPAKKGEVRFTEQADTASLNLVPRLRSAADSAGLKFEFESRKGQFIGYKLSGTVEGKSIEASFKSADDGLKFLRDMKLFDPVPEVLTNNRLEVIKQTHREWVARKTKKPIIRVTQKSRTCLSPCVERNILTDAERVELFEQLKDTPASEQAANLLKPRLSVLEGLKSKFTTTPVAGEFLSPSFHLEKFPAGLKTIRAVDKGFRDMFKWLQKHNNSLFGRQKINGVRTNAKVPFTAESPESLAMGVILESPESASRFAPKIRRATEFMRRKFEEHADEYGLPKEKRIKNYLTHVFDREELRLAFQKDINSLATDTSPTARARLTQLQDTLDAINRGETLLYERLPQSIRMRFFETRKGKAGFSFDAVKAYNTYQAALSRKMFMEPIVKEAANSIPELPTAFRPLMRKYLRDAVGIVEKINDPLDRIAQVVREVQFTRTIGLNPNTAVKNLFQQFFTIAELGPNPITGVGHQARGWIAYLTPEGRQVFADSGHALDVPNIFINRRTTVFSSRWRRAVDIAGWMFNKVETANRATAYLGALSKWFAKNGKSVGMDFETAIKRRAIPREAAQFADDIVRKTQFRYGKVDLPLFLRKPIPGTAFQFASFGIKASELMWKWAVREGITGRIKLMSLITAASGVTTIGALVGLPTLGDGTASPVDLTEGFKILQATTAGDWSAARTAAKNVVNVEDFLVTPGPAASFIQEAATIARQTTESEFRARAVVRFGAKNVLPVFARRLMQAVEQLEAGGNAADFVTAAFGLPNSDTLIRRQFLSLMEQGKTATARELLVQFRRARGKGLPVNFSKVGQIRRERDRQRKQDARRRGRETIEQRLRRRLIRREVERTLGL